MGPDWIQIGSRLGPDWVQTGSRLAPDWVQIGFRFGPEWVQIYKIVYEAESGLQAGRWNLIFSTFILLIAKPKEGKKHRNDAIIYDPLGLIVNRPVYCPAP